MEIRNFVREVLVKSKPYENMDKVIRLWEQKQYPDVVLVTSPSGQPVGILTAREFLNYVLAKRHQDRAPNNVAHWMNTTDWVRAPLDAWPEQVHSLSVNWVIPVDKNGQAVGVIQAKTLAELIADRYRTHAAYLENILDATHNAVIAIDKHGRVTFYNKMAEKLIWRKRDEVLGKPLSEVIIPQGLMDVVKTGKSQLAYKFTIEYSRGARTYITNRTPIFKDGEVVGAVGVFQDISEVESLAEELTVVKNMNAEFQTALEASYNGIIITDTEGRVTRANRSIANIFQVSPEALIGKTVQELVKEGVIPASLEHMLTGETSRKTLVLSILGHQFLVTRYPIISSNGQLSRILTTMYDLTELNQLQQQLMVMHESNMRYKQEIDELKSHLNRYKNTLVIKSKSMHQVFELVLQIGKVNSTVLICGETGVGKDVVARLIHNSGPRRPGPFVKINCGAIPENLLESELFGYEPGAFSGASREGKKGLFEIANNGTLFLDEISELPRPLQVKLLHALQEKEILRIGGVKPRKINVRVIAATNRDLKAMVEQGLFREDLYFRLNIIPIHIPPLRERKEEIIPLAHCFLKKFCEIHQVQKTFAPEVFEVFLRYGWPGNVRELENMVERLVVATPNPIVSVEDLPSELSEVFPRQEHAKVLIEGIMPLKTAVDELERQLIEKALNYCGSTYKAAKALQVNQSTIARKLRKFRHQQRLNA